ncbi:MAG: hypothetical protein JMN25_17390 [gamma proteobacterium endosymbiont of Lamellibrachia anaximandri]|nr:hypothetical protein [gamma proteobacterium endosymbiont of Lamellibrachia anaximandri]
MNHCKLNFKVTFIALMLSMLFAAGCGLNTDAVKRYTMDAAAVTVSLARLDTSLDIAAAAVKQNAALYSTEELKRLQNLQAELYEIRVTIRQSLHDADGLAEAIITADNTRRLYRQGKAAYQDARAIISTKIDQLPAAERNQLLRLDAQARRLDLPITHKKALDK